jgi:antitoxin component YwqK of YwqJK toxin-antitoxin module
MNKFLFLFIFLPFLSFAQVNQKDAKGRKQGAWQKNYPNSNVLIYKGQFKDDVPVGEFTYFYPTGEVRAIIEHVQNSKRSYGYYYHKNKELMSEGPFWDQKKDSVWANYNPEGYVIGTEEYKEDKLNGKRVLYFLRSQQESGKMDILSIAFYKDSVLHGEFNEFFSNGKLKKSGVYAKGLKTGEWREFDMNGNLTGKVRYKDGLPHGWAYAYNAKGQKTNETMYQYGIALRGKELEEFLLKCEKQGIDPNQ